MSQPSPPPSSPPTNPTQITLEPQLSWVDRVFRVAASPWTTAIALSALAARHIALASHTLDPTSFAGSTLSLQTLAVGLLVTNALALLTSKVLPALRRTQPDDTLAADLTLHDPTPEELSDFQVSDTSPFHTSGTLAWIGAAGLMVALIAFSLTPFFHTHPLSQGGLITLSSQRPGEAAFVDLEGVRVKANLGGWKLSLVDVQVNALSLTSQGQPPQVTLDATFVPTQKTTTHTLTLGQDLVLGDTTVRLASIAPTPQVAGLLVDVIQTQPAKTLERVPLVLKRTLQPLGPSGPSITLDTVETSMLGNLGLAASGRIQSAPDQDPQPFRLFEKSPQHDARHRAGATQIVYKGTLPGYKVDLFANPASSTPIIPICAALALLSALLLFSSPQTSAHLTTRSNTRTLRISSLNAAPTSNTTPHTEA